MTKGWPTSFRQVGTDAGHAARGRRLAVALTFPLAFAVHDGEEVLAARRWHEAAPALLRDRFPLLPQRVVQAMAVSPERMRSAVTVMSCAVAAVSAVSVFRLNRDRPLGLLRTVVAVFGAHSVTHAAQALVLRAYTPGVVSAALLVAPYSVWAWRTLNEADGTEGTRLGPSLLRGAPATVVLLVLAHILAAARERAAAQVTDAAKSVD